MTESKQEEPNQKRIINSDLEASESIGTVQKRVAARRPPSEGWEATSCYLFSPCFERSQSIALISQALAKAQGAMRTADKGGNNPHFKSKYSELSDVWEACRKPLADNELAVIQMPQAKGGEIRLTTILSHSSGEWFKSSLTAMDAKNNVQGVGSVITYLRRYSLMAMVGVAPGEDDDGNAAVQKGQQRGSYKQSEKPVDDKPPIAHLLGAIDESNGLWAMPDAQRYYKQKYDRSWPPTSTEEWRDIYTVVKSGKDPREVLK